MHSMARAGFQMVQDHTPISEITNLMYVIARSAVPDSQNILTIGMKLRIIFLLHNTSSSRCTGR
jgi:hypothetical protein